MLAHTQNIITSFFCTILLVVSMQVKAQISNDFYGLDTFSVEKHSGEDFAEAIKDVRNELINNNSCDSIVFMQPYLGLLPEFTFKDILNLRKAYMYHAYDLRNSCSKYSESLNFYLLAHEVLTQSNKLTDNLSWYIERSLGDIYTREGDFEKALYYLTLTKNQLIEEQNFHNLLRCMNNIALVYYSAGDFEKAIQTHEEAISQSIKLEIPEAQLPHRLNIIDPLLDLKDVEVAKIHFEQAKRWIKEENIEKKIKFSYNAGRIEAALENYQESIDHFQDMLKSMKAFYENHYSREFAKSYFLLAVQYLKVEEFAKCRSSIFNGIESLVPTTEKIILDKSEIYSENAFFELYQALGEYYIKTFQRSQTIANLDSAKWCFERVIYTNDLLKTEYAFNNSKIVAQSVNRDAINNLIDVAHILDSLNQPLDQKLLRAYFTKSKNSILYSTLYQKEMVKYLDAKIQTKVNANFAKLSELQDNYENWNHAETKEAIFLAEENKIILDSIVQKKADPYNGYYIDYVITSQNLYSLDNFKGKLRLTRHCNSSLINIIVDNLRDEFLDLNKSKSLKYSLRELYKLVFKKLEQLPNEFSILSDGPLNFVPLDLAIDSTDNYLLKSKNISLRISLFANNLDYKIPKKIWCWAPNYGDSNGQLALNRGSIYPLIYAQREAKQVQSLYPQSTYIENANLSSLKKAMNSNDVIHYTGHAREDGKKGRLILGKNYNIQNLSISGVNISGIVSQISLVVLSACETNVGKNIKGEGAMTLTRAFLEAGAQNVISSLWAVNDQSTSSLMGYFHENIRQGNLPADALRNAKIKYLESFKGEKIHPYFWGGFTTTTTNNNKPKSGTLKYVLLASVGLFVSYLFIKTILK